jgi:hypothetical protein
MPTENPTPTEKSANRRTRLSRRGLRARIDAPEGAYSVIYAQSHELPQDPKWIPGNLDGMILESNDPWTTKDPTDIINIHKNPPNYQYSSIFPVLEQNQTPTYFTDPIMGRGVFETDIQRVRAEFLAGTVTFATGIGGLYTYHEIRNSQRKIEKLTRRQLLSLGIPALAGTWLAVPFLSEQANGIALTSGDGEHMGTTKQFMRVANATHPEMFLYTSQIRNAVMAYKLQRLAQHSPKTRPHLGTILGGQHILIEDDLQREQEVLLAFLKNRKSCLELFNQESLYQIARMDFDGSQWNHTNTFEVPELKKLVEK